MFYFYGSLLLFFEHMILWPQQVGVRCISSRNSDNFPLKLSYAFIKPYICILECFKV